MQPDFASAYNNIGACLLSLSSSSPATDPRLQEARGAYETGINIYVCVCLYIYVYIYVYVYMCICIYVNIYVCIYIYVYLYIYIYVHIYICICIYHTNVFFVGLDSLFNRSNCPPLISHIHVKHARHIFMRDVTHRHTHSCHE